MDLRASWVPGGAKRDLELRTGWNPGGVTRELGFKEVLQPSDKTCVMRPTFGGLLLAVCWCMGEADCELSNVRGKTS